MNSTQSYSTPQGPRNGKHILLADDDPAVRESLRDVLVGEGYFLISAENGEQALELVSKWSVDVVVLDLNMPVKNGWDTFEQLTTEHPLVPTIIITARPNQLFMALNAGADAFLEKPMEIPVLLRTIKEVLAEPTEQHLARLAGKQANVNIHYRPAPGRM